MTVVLVQSYWDRVTCFTEDLLLFTKTHSTFPYSPDLVLSDTSHYQYEKDDRRERTSIQRRMLIRKRTPILINWANSIFWNDLKRLKKTLMILKVNLLLRLERSINVFNIFEETILASVMLNVLGALLRPLLQQAIIKYMV